MQIENPDMGADVVIIGYGGAGATAAITAHDMGASVIILEKMPTIGGNTRVSGGMMPKPKNREDSGKFAEYLKEVCFGTTEPELIDAYVDGLMDLEGWLEGMGGKLGYVVPHVSYSFYIPHIPHTGIPAGEGLEMGTQCMSQTEACPQATGGARMFGFLSKQIEQRGIKVLVSTRAKELVKNERGEIVGVIAESAGKSIYVKSNKGVIMACGGFENDDALKWDNLEPKPLGFMGSPGNTGDGIRMVTKVGGALWHMGRQVTSIGYKVPEYEAYFDNDLPAPGFIYVDKYGYRFANEPQIEKHEYWKHTLEFDNLKNYEYPQVPAYLIFDEEVRRAGPINFTVCGYNLVAGIYEWSADNSAEVKKGWIKKSKNIAELAKTLSMDPEVLEASIKKYNEDCNAGVDTAFGRPKESLKAIEPPYYSIAIWPMLVNTQGGARRDKDARVINVDGNPIPGLYAAGEFGSIWGFLYPGGGNFAEALVYGRIAGRSAATTPPVGK